MTQERYEAPQNVSSEQIINQEPVKKPQKSQKKLIIIIVVIVLVLMAGIGGLMWFLMNKHDGNVDGLGSSGNNSVDFVEDSTVEGDQVVELDIGGELVQRLYSNMIASKDLYISPMIYSSERMMAGDFTENEMKIWTANALAKAAGENGEDFEQFSSITRCKTSVPMNTYLDYFGSDEEYEIYGEPEYGCYDGAVVQAKVKEIFGVDVVFEDNETLAHNFCGVFLYSAQTDEFYTMAECGGAGHPYPEQVLYKAEKTGDKVYSYEAAAWMVPFYGSNGLDTHLSSYRYKILTDAEYLNESRRLELGQGYAGELIRQYDEGHDMYNVEFPVEEWQEWDKYRWEFVWDGENYIYSKVEKI